MPFQLLLYLPQGVHANAIRLFHHSEVAAFARDHGELVRKALHETPEGTKAFFVDLIPAHDIESSIVSRCTQLLLEVSNGLKCEALCGSLLRGLVLVPLACLRDL